MSTNLWCLTVVTVAAIGGIAVLFESNCGPSTMHDTGPRTNTPAPQENAGCCSQPLDAGVLTPTVAAADDTCAFDRTQCSLNTADRQQRIDITRNEILSRVEQTDRLDNGYRFRFSAEDNTFVRQLTDWVLAERTCCSFFQFRLTFEPNGPVSLEMTGTPHAVELIETLVQPEATAEGHP